MPTFATEEDALRPRGDMGEDRGAGQQGQEAGRALEDEDDRQRSPERGHCLMLASHWLVLSILTSLSFSQYFDTYHDKYTDALTLMEIRSRYQYQCCGALTHYTQSTREAARAFLLRLSIRSQLLCSVLTKMLRYSTLRHSHIKF